MVRLCDHDDFINFELVKLILHYCNPNHSLIQLSDYRKSGCYLSPLPIIMYICQFWFMSIKICKFWFLFWKFDACLHDLNFFVFLFSPQFFFSHFVGYTFKVWKLTESSFTPIFRTIPILSKSPITSRPSTSPLCNQPNHSHCSYYLPLHTTPGRLWMSHLHWWYHRYGWPGARALDI